MRIRYRGASTVREVTTDQLELAGVTDHDGKDIYIDTRTSERNRVVDVSDATAELLLEKEPDDWASLTDEENARLDSVDSKLAAVKAAREAEAAKTAEEEALREQKWLSGLEDEAERTAAEEAQDEQDKELFR